MGVRALVYVSCHFTLGLSVFGRGGGNFESLIMFYGEKAVGPNPNRRTVPTLNPYSFSGAWRDFFEAGLLLPLAGLTTALPGLVVEVKCDKPNQKTLICKRLSACGCSRFVIRPD